MKIGRTTTVVPARPDGPTPANAPHSRFRWTAGLARLLGKVSDPELARRAGVGSLTVFHERLRRRIPAFRARGPSVVWTPEMIALLGTGSDASVGAELGVTQSSVSSKRRRLGIESCHPPVVKPYEWTSSSMALLGTASDRDIGRRLGISTSSVAIRRNAERVRSFRLAPPKIVWTPEMLAALDTMSDPKFAARFRISVQSVREYRLRKARQRGRIEYSWSRRDLSKIGEATDLKVARGLRVPRHVVANKRRALKIAGTHKVVKWTPAKDRLLGKDSDRAVAERVGCSKSAVRARRVELVVGSTRLKWPPEKVALLGTESDARLGRRFGCSAAAVCIRRVRLGIPSVREWNGG